VGRLPTLFLLELRPLRPLFFPSILGNPEQCAKVNSVCPTNARKVLLGGLMRWSLT
jgi:hypothetical protein